MTSQHAGNPGWWLEVARRGTPLLEPLTDGRWRVTFLWRDPQGCELTSAYRRVWIHINCLTDHHQQEPPQSLQRLNGSDVWYWQTELHAEWRGSYCFIPCLDDSQPARRGAGSHAEMHAARQWWHRAFAHATHDLLNPYRAWPGVGGHFLSGLHMPQAPQQPAWHDFDNYAIASARCTPAPPARLQCHLWHSKLLGNTRQVWVYATGASNPKTRPLAILLDGQFWARQMPVWDPLMQLTATGELPEALYLLIDVIDQKQRAQDLPCNAAFWLAVQQELLPQLAAWAPYNDDAATTVVAGQSFGGLAALYAGLRWPQRFGAVISQSGSFWWPRRDMLQLPTIPDDACWLIRQLEQRQLGATGQLQVFLEAGVHEKLVHRVSEQVADLLHDAGHRVQYRVVEGGHDALCWRGGLLDGLCAHWGGKFEERVERKPLAAIVNAQGVRDGNPEPVR